MKVMVTENIAISRGIVNGAEGTVHDIVYDTDDEGNRYVRVVYVHIPRSGRVCDGLLENVVPIFPVTSSFRYPIMQGGITSMKSIARMQVPLLPAYVYTDYKSQGKSLASAVVDLESAQTLQGIYVMLSRVRSLSGLAILRPFNHDKLYARLSEELRAELARLETLNDETLQWYNARIRRTVEGEGVVDG